MLTPAEGSDGRTSPLTRGRRRAASVLKPITAAASGFVIGISLLPAASLPVMAGQDNGDGATTTPVSARQSAGLVAQQVNGGTFTGTDGRDLVEGSDASDSVLAAGGDDLISVFGGDDVVDAGSGNDATDAGDGMDMVLSGAGNDFSGGGQGGTEHSLGTGDDFALAGGGEDVFFGGAGSDWLEGGADSELLKGDGKTPYFDEPSGTGNDILVGQGGHDTYTAGGGDDILLPGAGDSLQDGGSGFDFSSHSRNDSPVEVDLLAGPEEAHHSIEALSGGAEDDVLRGDARSAGSSAAGDPFDVLNPAGISRIDGLAALLPGGGANGWDAGNILLGGAGSDTLEGRGTNDVIHGDAVLESRLSVRSNPADPASETRSATSLQELQRNIMDGGINPGDIVAVAGLSTEDASGGDVDTAVFSGPRSEYDIVSAAGVTIVTHTGVDGTDTLYGIELLQFSGSTVELEPQPEVPDEEEPQPEVPDEEEPQPEVPDELGLDRIDGQTKYHTSAAISAAYFEPDVPVVYIARGDHFADALTAGPAAHADGGPLLLVKPGSIPGPIADELRRLSPQRIVITGGHLAVSEAVAAQLQDYTDGTVTRVAGPRAADTAAEISRSSQEPGVDRVYVTTSAKFPDAMAGAAPAARDGHPVLLVGRNTIPAATAAELERLQAKEIVVLGGPLAVSGEVAADLRKRGPVTRVGGATLYDTAALISAKYFAEGAKKVFIATGGDFPDALSVGTVAGRLGAPILLVPSNGPVPAAVEAELNRLDPESVTILGGHLAVSADVESELRTILQRLP
ncbi:MAG TPA: cell wall-binding repeat-containing protein [Arthrobacter sp.]|nr:cell wall-binding repeat-containing protein [Arthrobacter sp.]